MSCVAIMNEQHRGPQPTEAVKLEIVCDTLKKDPLAALPLALMSANPNLVMNACECRRM